MNGIFKIGGAVVVGIGIMVSAVVFSGNETKPENAPGTITAINETESAPESAFASDTQIEVASSTNPIPVPEEVYVPETFTEAYSVDLFTDYTLGTLSGALNKNTMPAFIDASIEQLELSSRDELITYKDTRLGSDDSSRAHKEYGEAVAQIAVAHETPETNPLALLAEAVQFTDFSEMHKIEELADVYAHILEHQREVVVPPQLLKEHTDLMNTYQAVANDLYAMANAETDPLLTMVRVERYQSDTLALFQAYLNLYGKLSESNISYASTDAAYALILLLKDLDTNQ